jgi:predicted fused transcriptional regulator/phosphomethylpyrimidine kinase/predicted transcriptional regulator
MMEDFLPSMRLLVSRVLKSQGFSQSMISSMLGVTQASVSLYLSSETSRAYELLAHLSVDRQAAGKYAEHLAEDVKRGSVEGVNTLTGIWTGLLGNGSVCAAHRRLYPSLADCDVCIKEYGAKKDPRTKTVSEVADAVKLLETSESFVQVMPEVSVNIACAAGEAKTPEDIIAVPGRIVKVKKRARAMLPPEAGASTHLSKVLLLVMKVRPGIRACINLRYDKKMGRTLRNLGLRPLMIDGRDMKFTKDPTAKALEKLLERSEGQFEVVVDPGGSGIEPNVYVFAEGAREVAELALRLSRTYSAS